MFGKSCENEDSLDWAKRAYEKLKQQQEKRKKENLVQQEKDQPNNEINIFEEESNDLTVSISDEPQGISDEILKLEKDEITSTKPNEESILGDFDETFKTKVISDLTPLNIDL